MPITRLEPDQTNAQPITRERPILDETDAAKPGEVGAGLGKELQGTAAWILNQADYEFRHLPQMSAAEREAIVGNAVRPYWSAMTNSISSRMQNTRDSQGNPNYHSLVTDVQNIGNDHINAAVQSIDQSAKDGSFNDIAPSPPTSLNIDSQGNPIQDQQPVPTTGSLTMMPSKKQRNTGAGAVTSVDPNTGNDLANSVRSEVKSRLQDHLDTQVLKAQNEALKQQQAFVKEQTSLSINDSIQDGIVNGEDPNKIIADVQAMMSKSGQSYSPAEQLKVQANTGKQVMQGIAVQAASSGDPAKITSTINQIQSTSYLGSFDKLKAVSTLEKSLGKANDSLADSQAVADIASKVQQGQSVATEDPELVNKAYTNELKQAELTAGKPLGVVDRANLALKYKGAPIKAVQGLLERSIQSGGPQDAADALDGYKALKANNVGNLYHLSSQSKEIAEMVIAKQQLDPSLNTADAVNQARQSFSGQSDEQLHDLNKEWNKISFNKNPGLMVGAVNKQLSEVTNADSTFSKTNSVDSATADAYKQILRSNFMERNGNITEALAATNAAFLGKIGVSSAAGNRVIFNPPENNPKLSGIDPEVIKSYIQADSAAGSGLAAKDLVIASDNHSMQSQDPDTLSYKIQKMVDGKPQDIMQKNPATGLMSPTYTKIKIADIVKADKDAKEQLSNQGIREQVGGLSQIEGSKGVLPFQDKQYQSALVKNILSKSPQSFLDNVVQPQLSMYADRGMKLDPESLNAGIQQSVASLKLGIPLPPAMDAAFGKAARIIYAQSPVKGPGGVNVQPPAESPTITTSIASPSGLIPGATDVFSTRESKHTAAVQGSMAAQNEYKQLEISLAANGKLDTPAAQNMLTEFKDRADQESANNQGLAAQNIFTPEAHQITQQIQSGEHHLSAPAERQQTSVSTGQLLNGRDVSQAKRTINDLSGPPEQQLLQLLHTARTVFTNNETMAELAAVHAFMESGLSKGNPNSLTAHNNLFGVRGGDVVDNATGYDNGTPYSSGISFKTYDTLRDAFMDYKKSMDKSHYSGVKNAPNLDQAIEALHMSDYAQDPNYGGELKNIQVGLLGKALKLDNYGKNTNLKEELGAIDNSQFSNDPQTVSHLSKVNKDLSSGTIQVLRQLEDKGYTPVVASSVQGYGDSVDSRGVYSRTHQIPAINGEALQVKDARWGRPEFRDKQQQFKKDLADAVANVPSLKSGHNWKGYDGSTTVGLK